MIPLRFEIVKRSNGTWYVLSPRYIVLDCEPLCVGYNETLHDSVNSAIADARYIRTNKGEWDPLFAEMPIRVICDDIDFCIDDVTDAELVHFILSN